MVRLDRTITLNVVMMQMVRSSRTMTWKRGLIYPLRGTIRGSVDITEGFFHHEGTKLTKKNDNEIPGFLSS